MKKYSFDYNRIRERELDYKKINKHELNLKSKDIHQEMDFNILLARKFEEDKKLLEEQIERVYNSDLDFEDKREQVYMLNEMIQVVKDEYEEQVEKEVEKKQVEEQEILCILEGNAEILKEQLDQMINVQFQSGCANLENAMDKTKRMQEYFEQLCENEMNAFNEQMDQIKVLRKQMHKDKARTL